MNPDQSRRILDPFVKIEIKQQRFPIHTGILQITVFDHRIELTTGAFSPRLLRLNRQQPIRIYLSSLKNME